jgi:TonB family protein
MFSRLGLLALLLFINGCAHTPQPPEPPQPYTRDACSSTAECVGAIKSAVENSWKERYVFDQRLRAAVLINLDKSFNVTSVEITQSSGDEKFDESTLRAVRNTSPFIELRGLAESERTEFESINFVFGSARP